MDKVDFVKQISSIFSTEDYEDVLKRLKTIKYIIFSSDAFGSQDGLYDAGQDIHKNFLRKVWEGE